MSTLLTGDIFLVNRKVGTEWQSFQVDYDQLVENLNGEFGPDLPSVGYALTTPGDETTFTTDGAADNKLLKDVTQFEFYSGMDTVQFLKKDDIFTAFNTSKSTSVTFKCTDDSTSGVGGSFIKCVFLEGDETTVLNVGNIVTFRKSGVTGGGGSINSGPCPPGYTHNSVTNTCLIDPDAEPNEEGSLWFNENNGILYIWYENTGAINGEGQWVDVRPSGSSGGGTVSGDYIPLGSWSAIDDLSTAP